MEESGAGGAVWVGDRAVGVTNMAPTLVGLLISGSPRKLDQLSLGKGGPA